MGELMEKKEIVITTPKKIYLVKKVITNRGYKERGDENLYPAKKEYTTFEEALSEAKRLSAIHSGCFMVFESIYYIESVEIRQEGQMNV